MEGSEHKKNKWYAIFVQLIVRYKDDDVSSLSAQITYYLLLAIFPFLLFLLNIFKVASISISGITETISRFLPRSSAELINETIIKTFESSSTTLLSVGAIVTAYSASKGINVLRKGLNRIYDQEESRSFLVLKAIAFFSILGMTLLILSMVMFQIFGRLIGEYIFDLMDLVGVFENMWELVRFAAPILLLIFVFSIIYRFLPNHKVKHENVWPGSIFTAVGWVVISALFSFYVNNFANYSRVYGSIGGIIIMMIWLYLSAMIILLGGEINTAIDYLKSDKKIDKYEDFKIKIPFVKKK